MFSLEYAVYALVGAGLLYGINGISGADDDHDSSAASVTDDEQSLEDSTIEAPLARVLGLGAPDELFEISHSESSDELSWSDPIYDGLQSAETVDDFVAGADVLMIEVDAALLPDSFAAQPVLIEQDGDTWIDLNGTTLAVVKDVTGLTQDDVVLTSEG